MVAIQVFFPSGKLNKQPPGHFCPTYLVLDFLVILQPGLAISRDRKFDFSFASFPVLTLGESVPPGYERQLPLMFFMGFSIADVPGEPFPLFPSRVYQRCLSPFVFLFDFPKETKARCPPQIALSETSRTGSFLLALHLYADVFPGASATESRPSTQRSFATNLGNFVRLKRLPLSGGVGQTFSIGPFCPRASRVP